MGYSKRDLTAVADRAIVWDDVVGGLGLRRVDTRRGVTWSWVVDYRTDGRRRRMVLGRYPDIAVDDARTLARRAHARARGRTLGGPGSD